MSNSFKKHYWSSKMMGTSYNKAIKKGWEKAVRNHKEPIPNGNWYRKLARKDRWDHLMFYGGTSFENYWFTNLPRQKHWENIWGFQIKPKKEAYKDWISCYGGK